LRLNIIVLGEKNGKTIVNKENHAYIDLLLFIGMCLIKIERGTKYG